jgi:hypothetical protein
MRKVRTMLDGQTTQKSPPLYDAKRDILVAALPFAVALLDALPAHIVPRPLLRSDTLDLLEQIAGKNSETPVARATKALKRHLQPVAKQPTGDW